MKIFKVRNEDEGYDKINQASTSRGLELMSITSTESGVTTTS
jgi:hypothetical protein